MVSIKLCVGGTFILSIDLIGTKWATVFSLKNENKPTFNCEHTPHCILSMYKHMVRL